VLTDEDRLGTFYNAIPGPTNKQKVKDWAWKAYPQAYEDLLKHGTYTVVRVDDNGEEQDYLPKETFFEIGAIGRDVEV
jgi:hypothetical protein